MLLAYYPRSNPNDRLDGLARVETSAARHRAPCPDRRGAYNLPLCLLFVRMGRLRDLSILYFTLLIVIAVNLKFWMSDVRLR